MIFCCSPADSYWPPLKNKLVLGRKMFTLRCINVGFTEGRLHTFVLGVFLILLLFVHLLVFWLWGHKRRRLPSARGERWFKHLITHILNDSMIQCFKTQNAAPGTLLLIMSSIIITYMNIYFSDPDSLYTLSCQLVDSGLVLEKEGAIYIWKDLCSSRKEQEIK